MSFCVEKGYRLKIPRSMQLIMEANHPPRVETARVRKLAIITPVAKKAISPGSQGADQVGLRERAPMVEVMETDLARVAMGLREMGNPVMAISVRQTDQVDPDLMVPNKAE
jgi:hypothetical protein